MSKLTEAEIERLAASNQKGAIPYSYGWQDLCRALNQLLSERTELREENSRLRDAMCSLHSRLRECSRGRS